MNTNINIIIQENINRFLIENNIKNFDDNFKGNAYNSELEKTDIMDVYVEYKPDEEDYQEDVDEESRTDYSYEDYLIDNTEFSFSFQDKHYGDLGYESGTLPDLYGKIPGYLLQMLCNDFLNNPDKSEYIFEDIAFNRYSEHDDIEYAASMLYPTHNSYYQGLRGFVFPSGLIIQTEAEHTEITWLKGIETKYQAIEKGLIRLLPNSIDIATEPTFEQQKVIGQMARAYSDDVLYLDLFSPEKDTVGVIYHNPDYRKVINDINSFYKEGIIPETNQ